MLAIQGLITEQEQIELPITIRTVQSQVVSHTHNHIYSSTLQQLEINTHDLK